MTIPANNGQATGTTRLTGKARGELERQILDNPAVKGIDRLVLIELFGWFRGKAVCWPGNVAIASAAGLCPRSVQNAVKRLEDAEVIKTVDDSSVRSRRQIVLLDHSGATAALAALNASPHVNPDRCRSNPAKIAAAKAAKTPSDNSNGRVNQIHPEGCTRFTPEGEPDSPKAHNCVSARPESPPTPTSESTPSSSSSSNSRGGPDDDDDGRSALLEPEEKTPEKTATLGTMDDVLDVMRRCTRIPKSLLDAIPGKTDLGYRIKGDWCTLALAAMRLDEKIRDKDAPPAGKIERPLAYLLGVFNEIKAPDFPPGERDDLAGKVERLRERAQEQTPTKGDFDESSYRVVVQGWIARAVETNVPAREIGPRIMGHIDKLADANPMAGTWEFQARERIATEEITAFLVGRGAS